jgi:hypothetical protein
MPWNGNNEGRAVAATSGNGLRQSAGSAQREGLAALRLRSRAGPLSASIRRAQTVSAGGLT